MIPMDIPVNASLNAGTPASAPVRPAAAPAATAPQGKPGKAGAGKGSSFHDELRAVHDQMRAAGEDLRPSSAAGNARREDSGPSHPAAAEVTQAHVPQADNAQRRPESKQDLSDLWSLLLQLLQGFSTALPPAESAAEPDAEATGADLPEDDAAKALSELLDILKQLQAASEDVVHQSADAARLSELCEQLKDVAAAAPSAKLPEEIHQLLKDLRENLPGLAWGRMVKEVAADEPAAAPDAGDKAPPADAATPVRTDAPGTVQDLPEASLQAMVRKFRADAAPVARAPQLTATDSRTAFNPGLSSEDAKLPGVEREPLARIPSASTAPPTHASEGGRGPEAARPAAATADPSGLFAGAREDQGAHTGEDRPPPDDRLTAKTVPGADAAAPEGADPAEPFELGTAGQRPLNLHEGGLEKASEAVGVGKEKEAAGAGRAGVLDQIVQRAIVQVKNDQSEIRIDLKPDFLGHVRMQVVTENQQVSVRILTELPVVRDMIEAGLQQLRSELQNQGLHVDRLEVAVSDDRRQPPRRQAKPGEPPRAGGVGAISGAEGPVSSGRIEPSYYQRRAGSTATIDMFA